MIFDHSRKGEAGPGLDWTLTDADQSDWIHLLLLI